MKGGSSFPVTLSHATESILSGATAAAIAAVQKHHVEDILFRHPSKPAVVCFRGLTVLVLTEAPLTDNMRGPKYPCSRTRSVLIQTYVPAVQFHCSGMVYSSN